MFINVNSNHPSYLFDYTPGQNTPVLHVTCYISSLSNLLFLVTKDTFEEAERKDCVQEKKRKKEKKALFFSKI